MGDLATINISRAAADAAAERAKQQGLTTEDYLSGLVFRDLEREPDERSILAYDHLEAGTEFVLDREEGEADESYQARASHFSKLFP
jgi:hypothetical protein